MARRWRAERGVQAPLRSCPEHSKSIYLGEPAARAAARAVEVREGLEPGGMSAFYCPDAKGWHIGHTSIRERLNRD